MGLRQRKFRLRSRKLKKFLPIVTALVVLVAFGYIVLNNADLLKSKSENSTATPTYKYSRYYAAITHYTSERENVGFSDLKGDLTNPESEKIIIPEEERENIKKLFEITDYSTNVTFTKNTEIISKIIQKEVGLAIIPIESVDFRVKTLKIDDKFIWDKSVTDYPMSVTLETENQNFAKENFEQKNITKITNIGDVILGRHVAYKMQTYNDYTHPWLLMADFIKNADITFADLEVPLSDQIDPPDEGMSFVAPQKSIEGLKLGGIDIVALANNHSTNFGTDVFSDTLALLKKEGILYCGGGANYDEAYAPAIIEKNGLKFAFLDYNSIVGAVNATEDSAGVAKFAIKPWAETDDEGDIERIKNAVKKAKTEADIVIVELHWGVEYQAEPIQSQINVAHAAIDSGADLIIGTHPHVVEGMETYNNVPIFYSLGNFIFDQEWSTETKQGIVAETYFYGKKLVSTPVTPYQIEDYNQPHMATVDQAKQILGRIFGASLSSDFSN
jgi:poly-gamma-glutamate synthesis protein (capsule biosynthesis protein)